MESPPAVKVKLEDAKHEFDPDNVRADFNLMRELFSKMDELLKPGKFRLMIDGLHVVDWFKQKYREVQKVIGIHIKERPEVGKRTSFKL